MTNHVAHTNKLLMELKQQYAEQITHLRSKIRDQEEEIIKMQDLINMLSMDKEYEI